MTLTLHLGLQRDGKPGTPPLVCICLLYCEMLLTSLHRHVGYVRSLSRNQPCHFSRFWTADTMIRGTEASSCQLFVMSYSRYYDSPHPRHPKVNSHNPKHAVPLHSRDIRALGPPPRQSSVMVRPHHGETIITWESGAFHGKR